MQNILVTGGAGYIGSHVVLQLIEQGYHVVVLDNLSTGFKQAVHKDARLVIGDTGDYELVGKLLQDEKIDALMHFAAHTIVPESVEDPLKYYGNNTCSSRSLLQACADNQVTKIIFSSTAAVYGIPKVSPVFEDSPTDPINPYGSSKLMTELMLRDLALAKGMTYVALRYFNVAGSDPQGRIGQSTRKATLLIKVAAEVAVGKREKIFIFGTDYDTEDGTGIRDYIHVTDLAAAHIDALTYLKNGGDSITLNCGYGHGYSVRQVLDSVDRVNGSPIIKEEYPRRAGDPPSLVAGAEKIKTVLSWIPKHDDLDFIVKTSLDWERKLLTMSLD